MSIWLLCGLLSSLGPLLQPCEGSNRLLCGKGVNVAAQPAVTVTGVSCSKRNLLLSEAEAVVSGCAGVGPAPEDTRGVPEVAVPAQKKGLPCVATQQSTLPMQPPWLHI